MFSVRSKQLFLDRKESVFQELTVDSNNVSIVSIVLIASENLTTLTVPILQEKKKVRYANSEISDEPSHSHSLV